MNVISAQKLFANLEFHGPRDLCNDTLSKVYRVRMLLETLLKPENAAACELDADEKRDFSSLYQDICTGLKLVPMLGSLGAHAAMMATWKAMGKQIDEYFDAYEELKAAYQALA